VGERGNRRFAGSEFHGPEGLIEAKTERLMSLRIAVAILATIGAGTLLTT